MLDAYDSYRNDLKELESADIFNLPEHLREHYNAVRTYLNISELLAIGITKKAFDESVCYGFWYSIVQKATIDGSGVIQHARKEPRGEYTYEELPKLMKKWDKRSKRRFRHRPIVN